MARILIIDDDDGIRKLLRKMLEQAGYDVAEASNGAEGIELFRENPHNLVITDLIMPWKDGLETIKELKEDFPQTKIIAISGVTWIKAEDYLRTAERLGADRTLVKPFEPHEILKEVSDLLRQGENGKTGEDI